MLAQYGLGKERGNEPVEVPKVKNFEEAIKEASSRFETLQTEQVTQQTLQDTLNKEADEEKKKSIREQLSTTSDTINRLQEQAGELYATGIRMYPQGGEMGPLNDARYRLAYIELQRGNPRGAIAIGEMLAQILAGEAAGLQAATVALAGYGRLISDADRSLEYASPEQVKGNASEIGPASDTYALGVLLYQLLTGRLPFLADSEYDLARQIDRWNKAKHALFQILDEVVAQRQSDGQEHQDILSLLSSATYEDGTTITKEHIYSELMTFLFAGHETTALSLTWAIYHLHVHTAALNRLRQEIDELPDHSSETLPQSPYLKATVQETLRIHPIVTETLRKLKEPMSLGDYVIDRHACRPAFRRAYAAVRRPFPRHHQLPLTLACSPSAATRFARGTL